MRNRSTHLVLIIVATNFAVFIADRTIAPGVAPIAFVASLAALTAIHRRTVLRPPVVAATVALAGLTLIELIDATGTLPVIRIRL